MHAHMPWYDETMSYNDSTRTTLGWGHRGDVAQQPPRWHGVFNKLNMWVTKLRIGMVQAW